MTFSDNLQSMSSCNQIEGNDRPTTPSQEDCCGNACNPCIFDIHKNLLKQWEMAEVNNLKVPPDKNFLSLTRYNKFIIQDITKASEDCIFIQLQCGSEDKNDVLFLYPSQHVMVKLSSTSKPYTPISWNQREIKLLIKLYPNGLASECIKQLKVNDDLYIRGPYGDFQYQQNSYKNIIMLCIGSGIAAMYPLAVSIIENELEDTRIYLHSGFRSFSHVPLKKELRLLTDYWNFECTLYLSQDAVNTTGIEIVSSRLNENVINKILSTYLPESTLVLICGTQEFNDFAIKILNEKDYTNFHIFK